MTLQKILEQSQLKFAGTTSILAWAGKNSVLQFITDNSPKFMSCPYVRKDGVYHYFTPRISGKFVDGYELVMTSSRDLNGE